jgi:hypothetical protein
MTLDDLIAELEKHPRDRVLRHGFANPHSYRGYYVDLAVEPREGVTVGSMLDALTSARGTTMCGYKGGDYIMHGHVDVYLARYGSCGEEIGALLLQYMLADVVDVRKDEEA